MRNFFKKVYLVCSIGGLFTVGAHATTLPKNNLHLQDTGAVANITEEQFNTIIDHIVDMWKPIAKLHGANLTAVKDWQDSTVNAYAQQTGSNWLVRFFGGLARRSEVTPDGFALVVCHELGHHFAGYAFYGNDNWAASEGQADYFSTQVCGRRIWMKSFNKNQAHLKDEASAVQDACKKSWSTPEDQALCVRIGDAGQSLANLLAAASGKPKPRAETPSTKTVSSTYTGHPDPQCRLDTYISGATCQEKFDLKVIPGKGHPDGQVSAAAEKEAEKYSCSVSRNYNFGMRPKCWFKSLL